MAELAQEFNCPFIACAQGSDVHQYLQIPARRRIITSALARAAAVITCSGELARLLGEAGVQESKLHPIYYGVETDIFHPGNKSAARAELNLPPEEKVLLFVGNFLPIKNPLLLVDAFAELTSRQPHQAFRLVLLGDGPLHGDIRRRAGAAGLADRVSLPGRKPPAAVARFMQAADVLCVPSDNEGVPNVIYEAMSCGLRVVATRVGGIPEIMTADCLGRLVERGNSPALAQAIAAVLATPAAVEKIVFHARQFSWERTAEQHHQVLTAALHPAGGGK
ncbi:MAG: glycosyltransferase [Verrucomicrobia bacterium]|nr:glycosyltransferase [Verrucomicrobiota bacterium]